MNYDTDVVSSGLKMLSALVVVLGGLLVLFYFMKRIFSNNVMKSGGNLIKVLGSTYVGLKKHISLVEVPGCVLVVGISGDRLSLLTRIEDPNLIDQIKQETVGKVSASFLSQLREVSKGIISKEKQV